MYFFRHTLQPQPSPTTHIYTVKTLRAKIDIVGNSFLYRNKIDCPSGIKTNYILYLHARKLANAHTFKTYTYLFKYGYYKTSTAICRQIHC